MAIANDSFTNGAFTSGTTHTFSHTCSGTDRILYVHAFINTTTDRVTGVTYNGTSMTLLHKFSPAAGRYLYVFALINPDTGANNVVISASASVAIGGNAVSYTGVSQTSQPEVTRTEIGSTNPDTYSITTTTDNSWAVLFTLGNNANPTASTGSTFVGQNSVYGDADVFDSGGAITPAGSYSMTLSYSSTFTHGIVQVAMAPSAGAAAYRYVPQLTPFAGL